MSTCLAQADGDQASNYIQIVPSYLVAKFESKNFFSNRSEQVKKDLGGLSFQFTKDISKKKNSFGGILVDFHRGKLNEKYNLNVTRIMGSMGKRLQIPETRSTLDLAFHTGPLIYRGKPEVDDQGEKRPNRKLNFFQTVYSASLTSNVGDEGGILSFGYQYTHNLVYAIAFKNTTHVAQDFRGHEVFVGLGFRF
jgi:hypothetical protein